MERHDRPLKSPAGIRGSVALIRHFDDVNDLSVSDRNTSLIKGQEYKAFKIAKDLVEDCHLSGAQSIFFIMSPKTRATESVQLIIDQLKVLDEKLKIRTYAEKDLRAIDEGIPILPGNYKPGDPYDGLKIAGKIFSNEVHGSDNGGQDNIDYRHGDSVVGGIEKHPELKSHFSKPGESYREVVLRLFELVIKFKDLQEKSTGKVKFAIVTHGQPTQIIKDLMEVFSQIKNNKISYQKGEILKLCWDAYKKRSADEKVTGRMDLIVTDLLFDERAFTLFKDEIKQLYGEYN